MDAVLPIAISPVRNSGAVHLKDRKTKPNVLHHLADHFVPHARNNYHPHIFSHRMTHLLSVLLISAKIFTIALVSFGPILPVFSEAITVSNIIDLTNQSRAQLQIAPLAESPMLDAAAQAKADDMLAKGYFSHTSPDGRTPWDFIEAAGFNYITAGENLAVNFTQAENVETAWMNSPGHRANIVNQNFQQIGIGVSQGEYQGHDAIFVVQMFGTPIGQKITFSNTPTPVTQPAQAASAEPAPAPAPSAKTVTANASPVQASTKPALSQTGSAANENPNTAPAQPQGQSLTATPAAELAVYEASSSLDSQNITVTAKTSDSAVKVIALFGTQAIMLQPKGGDFWQGQGNFSELVAGAQTVRVEAYDLSGNQKTLAVADVAGSTQNNFEVAGTVESAHTVSLAGIHVDPNAFDNKFYLLFIAAMLSSLIVAIAARRHVQHLSTVANGALVVMLAVLLWVT